MNWHRKFLKRTSLSILFMIKVNVFIILFILAAGYSIALSQDETFESGEFNATVWNTAQWIISDDYSFNGQYSAKTPLIASNNNVALETNLIDCGEGTVSFWYAVDSAVGDYLEFWVDDELIGVWSGAGEYSTSQVSGAYTPSSDNLAWALADEFDKVFTEWPGHGGYIASNGKAYTVTEGTPYTLEAGQHVFRWVYTKDEAFSGGEDTAWIDDFEWPDQNSENDNNATDNSVNDTSPQSGSDDSGCFINIVCSPLYFR